MAPIGAAVAFTRSQQPSLSLALEVATAIILLPVHFCVSPTDLNTWIAGSHGFAYSSMRATGNPSAAILLQSKHWIDTLTSAHVSA